MVVKVCEVSIVDILVIVGMRGEVGVLGEVGLAGVSVIWILIQCNMRVRKINGGFKEASTKYLSVGQSNK